MKADLNYHLQKVIQDEPTAAFSKSTFINNLVKKVEERGGVVNKENKEYQISNKQILIYKEPPKLCPDEILSIHFGYNNFKPY